MRTCPLIFQKNRNAQFSALLEFGPQVLATQAHIPYAGDAQLINRYPFINLGTNFRFPLGISLIRSL